MHPIKKTFLSLVLIFGVIYCFGTAALAEGVGSTYIAFMRTVYTAKRLEELYPYLPKESVRIYDLLSKKDKDGRLQWYKQYYAHDIKIQAEDDEGDNAELAGTGICSKNGQNWNVQVFATFLKEDDKWKIKEFRHDAIRSPYGSQINR